MTNKLIWIPNPAKYSTGDICKAGRITVGAVFQPTIRKGETPPWRAQVGLPGITMKAGTIDFATIEEARRRVETAVATWFKWTGE